MRMPGPVAGVQHVTVEGVRFEYEQQQPAVEGVSFAVSSGELLAIVGPNGCGKSTLLQLMIGALKPQAGQVRVDGRTLAEMGRIGVARRMAMVPQMAGGAAEAAAADFGGSGGFTVEQTVLMARYAAHVDEAPGLMKLAGGLGIFGFESAHDAQLAREAMWGSDVHHLVDRPVEALSGGERQRVAIARAMAQETPVMLLDEPTSALDLYHQLELVEQLGTLTRAGRIVVLVTHDLNLALRCATRVIVMDRGKVAADGAPGDVLVPGVLEEVYQVRVKRECAGLMFERRGS